jgi:hypothetical protein
MGMTIEDAILNLHAIQDYYNDLGFDRKDNESVEVAIATMRMYQMMQADYKARLKADMVAMLTEIQLECEENTVRWYVGRVDGKSDDVVLIDTLNKIIEQKINALKEN